MPDVVVLAAAQMRFKAQGFYFTGVALLACVVGTMLDGPRPSVVVGVVCVAFGLALCLACIALGRGYARTRVVVTDDEVIVFNVGTKDVFPIDEVLGFDTMTRTASNMPGVPTGFLRLTPRAHGIPRRFPVTALTWGPDPRCTTTRRPGQPAFQFEAHWDQLHDLVDELNGALDARRDGRPTADRLRAAHHGGSGTDHGRVRSRSVPASSTASSPPSADSVKTTP